jgi:hypothetical protein
MSDWFQLGSGESDLVSVGLKPKEEQKKEKVKYLYNSRLHTK